MAIDRTGISSLDSGAPEITYTGDQGPKSPDQQLMASADPMLVEEYQKYVFEMEEQGLQPISFKEFVQQIMSGMAEGGIARLGYAGGQLVKPGPGRPGYQGPAGGSHANYGGTSAPYGGGSDRGPREAPDRFGPAPTPPAPPGEIGGPGYVSPIQKTILAQKAEKDDWVEQKDIGTGDYRDVDPVTGKRIITPPISGGGEGLGPTGPTPAEIEAMRIKLLLQSYWL